MFRESINCLEQYLRLWVMPYVSKWIERCLRPMLHQLYCVPFWIWQQCIQLFTASLVKHWPYCCCCWGSPFVRAFKILTHGNCVPWLPCPWWIHQEFNKIYIQLKLKRRMYSCIHVCSVNCTCVPDYCTRNLNWLQEWDELPIYSNVVNGS